MFLKKVDTLQQELEKQSVDALLNGLPFIHTLRALSRVVESCFGMELGATYISDIKKFKRLYLALGVTVTPKVNICCNFHYLIFPVRLTFCSSI